MELPFYQQFASMIHATHILFLLLFIYLAINTIYLFLVAVAGCLAKGRLYSPHPDKKKIAVLITSYKDSGLILHTAGIACRHDYPPDRFTVFVAADRAPDEVAVRLEELPLKLCRVHFEHGSKARSLHALLNNIPEETFDIAVVLDEDNIMLPGFLEKVNAAFQSGYRAVQGHRQAKNTNTSVAVLDAASEEMNNHLFRHSQRALGFSASLIGSGMAFEYKKLKQIYNKPGILDNPACDREVDFEIMKAGITIEYIDNAGVLDEKVSLPKVYRQQRRRWLESQIYHIRLFLTESGGAIKKTKDYWNKLFINLILPRVFFLAVFFLLLLVLLTARIVHWHVTAIPAGWWLGLFGLYISAMIMSIPGHMLNRHLLKALLRLPHIVWVYLTAAAGMHSRRKEFVHTPKIYSDETGSSGND